MLNIFNTKQPYKRFSEGDDQSESCEAIIARQYHYVLPISIIIYIILQLLIGMRSGICDTEAEGLENYVVTAYYCAAFSFAISAVQQVFKIMESRMLVAVQNNVGNNAGIYCAALTVNLMGELPTV